MEPSPTSRAAFPGIFLGVLLLAGSAAPERGEADEAAAPHWAFTPPEDCPPPPATRPGWARASLDRWAAAVPVSRRRFLSELAAAVAAPTLVGSWTDDAAALSP